MANTTTNGESIAPRPMQQRKRTASEFGVPVLTSLPHVATRRHDSGSSVHRVDEVELPHQISRIDPSHPHSELSSPTLKLAERPADAPEPSIDDSQVTLGVHNPDADIEADTIPESERLSEVAYNWIAKISVTIIAIVVVLYILKGLKQQEALPVPDGAWDNEPIQVTDAEQNPFSGEAAEPVVPQIEDEETTQSGPMFIDPSTSPTEMLESTPFPDAPDEAEFAGMDLEAPVKTIEANSPFAELKSVESTTAPSESTVVENPNAWPPQQPVRETVVESTPSTTGGASAIVYPSTGYPEFTSDTTIRASTSTARTATPKRPAHSARIQLNGTIQKFKR